MNAIEVQTCRKRGSAAGSTWSGYDVPESIRAELKKSFRRQDLQGQGTISRLRLAALLRTLDSSFTAEELQVIFESNDMDRSGVSIELSRFIDYISDDADQVALHLSHAFGSAKSDGSEMASEHLGAIYELLISARDSKTLRSRQNAILSLGAIEPLLRIVAQGLSTDLSCRSLEIVMASVCGNKTAIATLVGNENFVLAIRKVLDGAAENVHQPPCLSLAALQVVRAAASSAEDQATEPLSLLVDNVSRLLTCDLGQPLVEAAVDVLALCAICCPSSVAKAVSWPVLASLVAEDRSRPAWLSKSPLQILSCGLLVSSLLETNQPNDENHECRRLAASRLIHGSFPEQLLLAMESAVSAKQWPDGSAAFHSICQLASAVENLTLHGCPRHRLQGSVDLLAEVVMSRPSVHTKLAAVRALQVLSQDDACQKALLNCGSSFRSALLLDAPISKHPLTAAATDLWLLLQRLSESSADGA